MSLEALNWAWGQDATRMKKLVLVNIAYRADNDGLCFPSRNTIALECGCSVSTVKRYLKSLMELGYLTIQPRYRDGRRTSNLYRLNMEFSSSTRPAPEPGTGSERTRTPGPLPEPADLAEGTSIELLAPTFVDAVWESLVIMFGEPRDEAALERREQAADIIRASLDNAGVAEERRKEKISTRSGGWPTRFPNVTFTDLGFADEFDKLEPSPRRSSEEEPERPLDDEYQDGM